MATITVSEDSSFAPGQFGQYQSSRFVTTPGLKTASPSNSSSIGGEQDTSEKGAAASHTKTSQLSSATSTSAITPHFGVLDLSPQIGILGPPKDGRVSRDAVPTKLKGKMDLKNGNFGVMHMDIGTRVEPMKQSVAAQRTSENTALAAEVAQREGYIPLKKRKLEASKPPYSAPQVLRPQLPTTNPPPYAARTGPLTAEQAKYEQARLLTLLRSINPLTVVDQLCKALAFFGGIPSAPPPADGRFPQSAEANGEGKLFLGWISEIFPDLEKKGDWKQDEPGAAPALNVGSNSGLTGGVSGGVSGGVNGGLNPGLNVGRRPRGRPKGSKARKVRSDKGIKKGPLGVVRKDAQASTQANHGSLQTANGEADDGWVDVGDGDAQNVAPNDADATDVDVLEVVEPTSNATDAQQQQEQQSTPVAAKQKGGRPRGSRNKVKSNENSPIHSHGHTADSGLELPPPPPGVIKLLQTLTTDTHIRGSGFSGSPTMEAPESSQRIKNKGGRPKGSKNKPKDGQPGLSTPVSLDLMGDPQSAVVTPSRRDTRHANNASGDTFAANNQQVLGLTAEELAVLEAFRKVRGNQTPAPVPPPEHKKRKRAQRPTAASKAAGAATTAAASVDTSLDAPTETTSNEPSTVNGGTQPGAAMAEDQGQKGAAGSASPAVKENTPHNKGQRSTKDSKSNANKRQGSQTLQSSGKEKLSDIQSSGISTSLSSPQLSLPATNTPAQSLNNQVQSKRPSSQTSQHYQPHQPQKHHFTSLNANHNQSQSQTAAQVAMQALQQSQNRQAQQSPIQTANTTATYFSQSHQPTHTLTRPSSTHTASYSPYSSISNLQQTGRQYSHSHSLSDSLQNDGPVGSNPYASPSSMSTNSVGVQSGNVNVGSNQGNNARTSLAVQQHGQKKQQNSFSTSSNNQNIHSSAQSNRHQQTSQSGLAGVVPQQNSHASGTGQTHNSGQERNGNNANANPYSYGYPDSGAYLDLSSNSSGVGHSHISNNNHSHTMSSSLSESAMGHSMFHSNQVGVNRGAGAAAGGISDIGFGGGGGGVGGAYDMGQGGMTDSDIREKLLGGLGRRG